MFPEHHFIIKAHKADQEYDIHAKVWIMKEMIRKGQVGVTDIRSLYRLSGKPSVHLCSNWWGKTGRPRFVEPEVIEDCVMKNLKGSSKSLETADLKSLINSGKCERMKWKGIVATAHHSSASPRTHKRYAMDIPLSGVSNGTLSICSNDNLTTDPRKTINMIETALRVPVYQIEPENVLSTDDTTEYIFHDKRATKDPWRIVEGAARASRGVNSFNHVDRTNARYGGFRIELMVKISAAGQMSRLVIICSGLSEYELNMDDSEMVKFRGMFVKKILVCHQQELYCKLQMIMDTIFFKGQIAVQMRVDSDIIMRRY